MATIFAHNRKAYSSWRRRADKQTGRSSALSGKALDMAIRSLAATNPEYVVTG